MNSETTPMDGRVLRGERNTKAIVDALLALYRRGSFSPTIKEVAEEAGVTARSIYHRFPDMQSLAAELVRSNWKANEALYDPPTPEGGLAQRTAAFIEQRAMLYEEVAPLRRAALANMHLSSAIRRQQGRLATLARRQVARVFAPELASRPREDREELLHAVDLLTSWESWERLRRWQRLKVGEAREVLLRLEMARLAQSSTPRR